MLPDSSEMTVADSINLELNAVDLSTLSNASEKEIVNYLARQLKDKPTYLDWGMHIDQKAIDRQFGRLLVPRFRLNKVDNLTTFFQSTFVTLQPGGFLVFSVEFIRQRKARLRAKLPWGVAQVSYTGDYLLHRLAPRLPYIRLLYRRIFNSTRVVSKAEVLGRLYHAGYQVLHVAFNSSGSIVIARRTAIKPVHNPESSEGLIFKMVRLGKNGKEINAYKLRTMHPYSEYLQEYLMQTSGLEAGGKFKDDFRISTLGRIARKYWLDELPMVINLLKGDLKLVGVRPISRHYFSLYPDVLKQERVKVKPGLLPPYYADMPRNFEEIVASELCYLRAYQQKPLLTDLRYLVRILANIILRSARSK